MAIADFQRVSHWHGEAAHTQANRRRRAVVACLCTVSAAVAVLAARQSPQLSRARGTGAQLLMQHEDIAGKEAERAEAKKLDSIEDPAGGSVRTGEQMESTQRPLRAGAPLLALLQRSPFPGGTCLTM
jgi:hypothetical protein